MTTLVTGAGLIGTAFAQEAAKRGERLDITAAREVLEWEPAYSLEEAFADYVEEFKRARARPWASQS